MIFHRNGVSESFCLLSFSSQVIIYQGGQVFSLANHLNGRVGFVATMPSTSASIFINNTQLSDTGTYQCLVNNLPDRGGRNIGVIGLTVLGKTHSAALELQLRGCILCTYSLATLTWLQTRLRCIAYCDKMDALKLGRVNALHIVRILLYDIYFDKWVC